MASSDNSVFTYNPSFALAIVATILYLIPALILTWQTLIKYRSWFFLCVLLGAIIEVAGYTCRAVATKHVSSIPPYAISATLIILAPIFIAAGNYLLVGRLIRAVLPSSHHRILRVPAHRITRLFVCCDILTFLVQASGSGIAGDWTGDKARIGANVIIGGLGLQVATFTWFLCVLCRFRVVAGRVVVQSDGVPKGWKRVFGAICVSSCLVLIRSTYRLIEFALGFHGYPFTHEWTFYVFEALPMLPAISVFCLVHPAKYLGSKGGLDKI